MAERRMFSKELLSRDSFITLSAKAQTLYLHLAVNADDEGFISSVKATMRKLKIGKSSLEELKSEGYIYEFDTGVVLITHWLLNNKIRPDRFKPTTYTQEKSCVTTGEGGIYLINKCHTDLDNQIATNGSPMAPQYSGRDISLAEVSLGCVNAGEVSNNSLASLRYGICSNVILTAEKYNKLVELYPDDYLQKINKLSTYMASHGKEFKDHFGTIVNWAIRDEVTQNMEQKNGSAHNSENVFKSVLENGEVNND